MRPKDSNQLAKQIVDISTGQMPDPVRPLRRTAPPKPRRTEPRRAAPRKP